MKRTKRMRLSALLMAAVLLCTACGGDNAKAATMHLTRTAGTVDVLNEKGKDVSLQENLSLYSGYQVGTRNSSFAWIDLDQVKLAKMDEDSEVEISKEGKELEILLQSGSLFFNVTEPLEDDETMEIRTSTMVVGIRGTCGWVEIGSDYVRVGLLEGEVECEAAGEAAADSVYIQAGMMATLTNGADQFQIDMLTAEDIPDFIWGESDELLEVVLADAEDSGFQDPGPEGTDGSEDEVYFDPEEGIALPEMPRDDIERTVAEVNDSTELRALVDGGNLSNTEIHLGDGTYNMGPLFINGYENLSIIGTGNTQLVVNGLDDEIIAASDCDNLLVYGLVMGHDVPPESECSTGVVSLYNSQDVKLIGCDIYGCGLTGISVNNSSLTAQNTVIRDCSYNGVEWFGGGTARFENCVFSGNGSGSLFGIYPGYVSETERETAEFTLENCIFQDNKSNGKYYFSGEGEPNWKETGTRESGNNWR